MPNSIVSEWALVRRGEMVDIPQTIEIHPDFLKTLEREAFVSAFRQIWDLFYQIYTDVAAAPERFSMPLYKKEEYRYGSKEAGKARIAAWSPFYLMAYLLSAGWIQDSAFVVDAQRFRQVNKMKNIHTLLAPLSDYGFVFAGLKDFKIPKTAVEFTVEYPANPDVLTVLSLVAEKVAATQNEDNFSHYKNSFLSWNYRILKDDLHTADFGYAGDFVADKMHNEADKNCIYAFHDAMKGMGYCFGQGGWNEGPDLSYYDSEALMNRKGPYLFRMVSWKGDLRLMLRIRSAEACLPYLDGCPEEIKEMFRQSDRGCENRLNGACKSGVRYVYEGQERWHCGCCQAAFQLHPKKEDIPHYLKLVKLGAKR